MFVPTSALVLARHAVKFGRIPNFVRPTLFSDHITRRLLFDRDPALSVICDKVAVKDFISRRVGGAYVVPLLGEWRRGSEIDFDSLPDTFVLKPSFLSGPFVIATRSTNRAALAREADQWVTQRPPIRHYCEWGHQAVPRRIMAEELMTSPSGGRVTEFDVHVFNGKALLLRALMGRKLSPERRDAWFDAEGRQVSVPNRISSIACELSKDVRDELIGVAEKLGEGFRFLRVDCYVTGEGLRVGELSPYPWGGGPGWASRRTNEMMGRLFEPGADTSHFEDYEP